MNKAKLLIILFGLGLSTACSFNVPNNTYQTSSMQQNIHRNQYQLNFQIPTE